MTASYQIHTARATIASHFKANFTPPKAARGPLARSDRNQKRPAKKRTGEAKRQIAQYEGLLAALRQAGA
jgi:hypothetical protein